MPYSLVCVSFIQEGDTLSGLQTRLHASKTANVSKEPVSGTGSRMSTDVGTHLK